MDFKHLMISTGAVSVLSNDMKRKAKLEIYWGKRDSCKFKKQVMTRQKEKQPPTVFSSNKYKIDDIIEKLIKQKVRSGEILV